MGCRYRAKVMSETTKAENLSRQLGIFSCRCRRCGANITQILELWRATKPRPKPPSKLETTLQLTQPLTRLARRKRPKLHLRELSDVLATKDAKRPEDLSERITVSDDTCRFGSAVCQRLLARS